MTEEQLNKLIEEVKALPVSDEHSIEVIEDTVKFLEELRRDMFSPPVGGIPPEGGIIGVTEEDVEDFLRNIRG